ncbi:hypothetical protein [Halomonas salipaludis]|nr:hypothetical protein [Halomonas salipaludis]
MIPHGVERQCWQLPLGGGAADVSGQHRQGGEEYAILEAHSMLYQTITLTKPSLTRV